MTSNRYNKTFILGTVVGILLVGAIFVLNSPFFKGLPAGEAGSTRVGGGEGFQTSPQGSPLYERGNSSGPTEVAELTQAYRSEKYGYNFKYPIGFTVRSFEDGSGDTVIVEKGTDGFQIFISPFDETGDITESRIRADIPDMKIEGAQPVLLGEQGKGLAFKSDNAAWGGASREVWFAFGGYLYQISTYERLDGLLRAVLATWQFE